MEYKQKKKELQIAQKLLRKYPEECTTYLPGHYLSKSFNTPGDAFSESFVTKDVIGEIAGWVHDLQNEKAYNDDSDLAHDVMQTMFNHYYL